MNWSLLKTLRERFLAETFSTKPYWDTLELLEAYDETFATRIGWKWDSVLEEIKNLLVLPESYTLVDWGAGTAIATRKMLETFSVKKPKEILLIEKSDLACQFAISLIQKSHPSLPVKSQTSLETLPPNSVVLLSHVLNELSKKEVLTLTELLKTAHTIIWVEAGTSAVSLKLGSIRSSLIQILQALAPCPHQNACPMLDSKNTGNWCHHFAKVPNIAFTTEKWARFSKEMGIDLRSLPLSYLVLSQEKCESKAKRLIGRARLYKGFAKLQFCSESGLLEEKWLEKNEKKEIKILKETPFHFSVKE